MYRHETDAFDNPTEKLWNKVFNAYTHSAQGDKSEIKFRDSRARVEMIQIFSFSRCTETSMIVKTSAVSKGPAYSSLALLATLSVSSFGSPSIRLNEIGILGHLKPTTTALRLRT